MRLPEGWNRSRAAALGATLVVHAALIAWLLALRFDLPEELADEIRVIWPPIPVTSAPPLPAAEAERTPPEFAPVTAPPLPMPAPESVPGAPQDWSQTAREVAKDLTAEPSYRPFGEVPQGPPERPRERHPPSIFEKPLPRVGKTVVTPEGETIIWVSDYCYVSISSRSLTQKEIHDGRKGVRMCVLAEFGGEKEARDDLFDPIKRPPPPQEPGCNQEGVGQSCGR